MLRLLLIYIYVYIKGRFGSFSVYKWEKGIEHGLYIERAWIEDSLYIAMAQWLRGWIPNPVVPCSKPLGGSKVDSVFHPF